MKFSKRMFLIYKYNIYFDVVYYGYPKIRSSISTQHPCSNQTVLLYFQKFTTYRNTILYLHIHYPNRIYIFIEHPKHRTKPNTMLVGVHWIILSRTIIFSMILLRYEGTKIINNTTRLYCPGYILRQESSVC